MREGGKISILRRLSKGATSALSWGNLRPFVGKPPPFRGEAPIKRPNKNRGLARVKKPKSFKTLKSLWKRPPLKAAAFPFLTRLKPEGKEFSVPPSDKMEISRRARRYNALKRAETGRRGFRAVRPYNLSPSGSSRSTGKFGGFYAIGGRDDV